MELPDKNKPLRLIGDSLMLRAAGDTTSKVDRANAKIIGAVVMKAGKAKGYGFSIDTKTLDQCARLGNKAAKGIKSRFGHPGKWDSEPGKFLGRYAKYRRIGDTVRADITFAKVAFNNHEGKNYADYIMDLAESDPDALGNSVVSYSIDFEKIDDEYYLRLNSLDYVDIVDEPGAADGMFSAMTVDRDDKKGVLGRVMDAVRLALGGDSDADESTDANDATDESDDFQPAAASGLIGGEPANKESVTMEYKDITLESLKANCPGLVTALAAETQAAHTTALAAAREEATAAERERCTKIVKFAKAHHHVKPADDKDSCALSAIKDGKPYADALEEMVELDAKRDELLALQKASNENALAAAAPGQSNAPKGSSAVGAALLARVKEHNKQN